MDCAASRDSSAPSTRIVGGSPSVLWPSAVRAAAAMRCRTAATGVALGVLPIACGQSISSRQKCSCIVSSATP